MDTGNVCDLLSERGIFETTDEMKMSILFKNKSMQTNIKWQMEEHPMNSCLFLNDMILIFILFLFLNFSLILKMSTTGIIAFYFKMF